jgi:hypothetical protein
MFSIVGLTSISLAIDYSFANIGNIVLYAVHGITWFLIHDMVLGVLLCLLISLCVFHENGSIVY